MSHPVWVRGLKRSSDARLQRPQLSHPVWVRGLKRQQTATEATKQASHPVWVRGLKHIVIIELISIVTSRTPCGCVD